MFVVLYRCDACLERNELTVNGFFPPKLVSVIVHGLTFLDSLFFLIVELGVYHTQLPCLIIHFKMAFQLPLVNIVQVLPRDACKVSPMGVIYFFVSDQSAFYPLK